MYKKKNYKYTDNSWQKFDFIKFYEDQNIYQISSKHDNRTFTFIFDTFGNLDFNVNSGNFHFVTEKYARKLGYYNIHGNRVKSKELKD